MKLNINKKILFLVSIVGGIFLFLSVSCLISFWKVDKDFPYSKVLYDKNNEVLASLIASDQQWRYKLVTKNVPEKLKKAIIFFEDKRFFSHPGVDILAMGRAFKLNLKHGRVVSGGSTITMQLARILYRNKARTYFQKLIEMLFSFYLEVKYSKEEILNRYVSFAPYGGNIVGAETASWMYFGRPLGMITWAESALLAVLPNNPSMIHINRNRAKLLIKRNKLLKRLFNLKVIDKSDLMLSLSEKIPEEVVRPKDIASSLLYTSMKKYPKKTNYFSTLDRGKQLQLMKVSSHSLEELTQKRISNLAILIIDNELNEVVAYEGNAKPKSTEPKAMFLDLATRARSTGSILKPFLFAHLLDQGRITSSSLISDIPTFYEGFKPKNFVNRYVGVVPANIALAQSLNIPAVRMLQEIGTSRFYDLLQDLNFKNINRGADNYGVSIILGGAEENLWRVTNAYAQMANVVSFMDTNVSRAHWLRDKKKSKIKFPLSIGASYLTLKALLDVNRPEGSSYWKSFSSSQKISWKTGTSQGFKDSWTVGTNGRYTVGVWTGNANGLGSADLIGVRTAAPVMFRVFNFLPHSNWFAEPTIELKEISVCDKSGYLAHSNCPERKELIPSESNFEKIDKYYIQFHMDKEQQFRVNSSCYPVFQMNKKVQFSLPPIESYYFKRSNISYRDLPKWKRGCKDRVGGNRNVSILYPPRNTQIYLPRGLDGLKNKFILKAAHSSKNAKLFWHLNDEFLGETTFEHHQEVSLKHGTYLLMVTDESGNVKKRLFEVLKN